MPRRVPDFVSAARRFTEVHPPGNRHL